MLTSNLHQSVLINPVVEDGADELLIVSGYATSAMAFWHLNSLLTKGGHNLKIRVAVGMCRQDGMSRSNHRGFQDLSNNFHDNFQCSYVVRNTPVHSKTYAWLRNGEPIKAFLGSANYTQTAFGTIGVRQREVMTPCNPHMARDYFERILRDTIYCTHNDVAQLIQIYSEQNLRRAIVQAHENGQEEAVEQLNELEDNMDWVGLSHVTLSLLDRTGETGRSSGLNWGQRPGREPNQAYIRVPSTINNINFFPEPTVQFTVLTDDNHVLVCTRAQVGGKAIQTPHNNSLIGLYFRNRLGLPAGQFVTLQHLQDYGRTNVKFYKIDDETYFMDFSVP